MFTMVQQGQDGPPKQILIYIKRQQREKDQNNSKNIRYQTPEGLVQMNKNGKEVLMKSLRCCKREQKSAQHYIEKNFY